MSGPIFIRDAQGRPLMPLAAAHARKLLSQGKGQRIPHHAFTIIQLNHTVDTPQLRPVVAGIAIHFHTAEIWIVAQGVRSAFPLLSLIIDLKNDLPRRLRRRAAHRRRRRSRLRYRGVPRHGRPFKLKRVSLLRSTWGKMLRQRWKQPGKRWKLPVVIQWRAQVLIRVLKRLRQWIPISQVIVLSPVRSNADLKLQSDVPVPSPSLRCAYCGTQMLRLERDHLVPQSRGGSDAWRNVVFACARCNSAKGAQTPDEAGMKVLVKRRQQPPPSKRMQPYIRQAARLLVHQLQQSDWNVQWPSSDLTYDSFPTPDLADAMEVLMNGQSRLAKLVVKPIAHSRKQVFTARNYPKATPLSAGFELKGRTVKRRLRVNRGLAIWHTKQKSRTVVIQSGHSIPSDADLFISAGFLCEARRAGRKVVGIVGAIHSTGRITLLVPKEVSPLAITWDRVVISPRLHFRLLGKDKVFFLPVPSAPLQQIDADDE
jgi:5-methylcytosine-specific restriction endonuclease McrA